MNQLASHSTCGCPGRLPFPMSRREWLAAAENGVGMMEFSGLFCRSSFAAPGQSSGMLLQHHFPPKVKNIIFCFMDGGVSHVDSFDPKPKLAELDGKDTGKIANPTANTNRKWLQSP